MSNWTKFMIPVSFLGYEIKTKIVENRKIIRDVLLPLLRHNIKLLACKYLERLF